MRSITLPQAALLAALAMVLLTGAYLVDNSALLKDSPVLVALGSVVPSLIWALFFFAVYRASSAARRAAGITLVALLVEAVVVYIRFQQSVSYWTPFGNALSLSGWVLRLGWAVFLIAYAVAPDHLRTRQAAIVVAIISAPSALIAIYNAWNSWIGLVFDDIPAQALWRVLITPAIRSIYWLSQILFLWKVWGNPESARSVEATSARLAP